MTIFWVLCPLLGYLVGSIPVGKIIANANGVDIQKYGSGNIGATNVLRSVGLKPALFVVFADPLKGALAVVLAFALGVGEWGAALTGLTTILGNNFSLFLGLRGGKGIATSLGVFLVIAPIATLAGGAVGIFVIALSRFVSLGTLAGAFSIPFFLLVGGWSPAQLVLSVIILGLALLRHRENLKKLAAGKERRLGDGAEQRPEIRDA